MAGTCKCGEPALIGDKCQACYDKEKAEFDLVKEYVMKHPRANAFEIVKATNVSSSKVVRFMKEKRLMQKKD